MSLLLRLFAFPASGLLKALHPSRTGTTDRQDALDAALDWLKGSLNPEGMPASGFAMIHQSFLPPTVEVTARWLSLLLALKKHDAVRFERLRTPGDPVSDCAGWLLRLQRNDGTWPAGHDYDNDPPSVPVMGTVLHALIDYRETADDGRATEAIRRGARWLGFMQSENGAWSHYLAGNQPAGVVAGHALLRAALTQDDESAGRVGMRNLEYALTLLTPETMKDQPAYASVSYAQMILALLEAGLLASNRFFAEAAVRGAAPVQQAITESGFLGEFLDSGSSQAAHYSVPYANCLSGMLGFRLYEHTRDPSFRHMALQALAFVQARQIRTRDRRIRGGITGSWPVSGNYKPYSVPGETMTAFACALLKAACHDGLPAVKTS